ncbi:MULTISPECIES: hypothetical protein [unclassified Bilifractor]|uniref:hypothetical protein n=1 Tax=unclassified Bilifractor TaxID=2815795 RepID=UPI003F8ECC3A
MNKSENGLPDDRKNITGNSSHRKYPWTMRRITALAGIILLLVMYALTMVFALVKSPYSKGLLMGSIFCTIAVPVLLYAMTMVARLVRGKGIPEAHTSDPATHAPDSAKAADPEAHAAGTSKAPNPEAPKTETASIPAPETPTTEKTGIADPADYNTGD